MCNEVLGLSPEQWTALSSIGTLAAVVSALAIAVFQDRMKQWFFKPNLKVTYLMQPPYCQKALATNSQTSARCYYFRIKVENTGHRTAEEVHVLAAELSHRRDKDQLEMSERFLPMHLTWSHDRKVSQSIGPGLFRFCDLCHIIEIEERKHFAGEDFVVTFAETFLGHNLDEEILLSFDTEVKPNTSTHLFPSGKYRLKLLVGAKNIKTKKVELDIDCGKDWIENQYDMFKDGISVKVRE